MAELIQLRCSGLPLNFKCPGSARPPALKIRTMSDPAALGIAAHTALQGVVTNGGPSPEELTELAIKEGVDTEDLRILLACGAKLWREVRESFPGAETEVEIVADFGDFVLSGHPDLHSYRAGVVRAGDWKTGRVDSDYSAQLKGYAVLLRRELEKAGIEVTEATGTVLWVRDCEAENYTLDSAAFDQFVASIREQIVNWDGTHHPGTHCTFCPRWHECEARVAHDRGAVETFSSKQIRAIDIDELTHLSDGQKLELYHQAKLVAELAETVKGVVKRYIQTHGPIVADGQRLAVVPEERSKVVAEKAWDVLEESGFTHAEFVQCVNIGVTAMKSVTAKKAGRGHGAGAIRELMAKLETAGAVEKTVTERFEEKRA